MSQVNAAGTGWQYADVWDLVAELRPGLDAVVHGDRRTSWAAFRDRAGRLASSLVEGGAGQGDRVAQYLYNSPEYLEVSYAAHQAGLTPVNTNYRYRADELAYLWDNADAVAVVFHGAFTDTIEAMRDRVPTVRRWLLVDDGSGPCPDWAEPYEAIVGTGPVGAYQPPWGRSGDDIVMIYTGGTTGMPKGVMWRHDDMYRSFNVAGDPDECDLGAVRDRLSAAGESPVGIPGSPLMHATGYMFAKSMLVQGGTVVTLPDRHFDVQSLLATIEREGVTAVAIVGDAFARPILEALDAAPGRWDLSSLQLLVSAGVMWSAETKAGLARHLPGTLFADLLGSTEANGLGSSVSGAGSDPSTATFSLGALAMVIDEEDNVLGPGGAGLLAVGGPGPVGYHKDPAKTAATFRTVAGQRVSVPGDWARVEDDGSITLLGRGSLCINTGGEKVFPEEVEEALETHPAVRDTTVVGVPDPALGEAVAAVVSLADGLAVTAEDLIAHVKRRIAGYKAPRHVLVVDDVGRAPNGKADYAGSRRLLLDHPVSPIPYPGSLRGVSKGSPVSPSAAPDLDKDALKARYRQERDKRLRPDGNAQYQRLTGRFAHYAVDPYLPVEPRDPITDDVTVAIIGGGFAGLLSGARLAEAGVTSARIIDKGGDFGGTWYWNRYPGAQCDTASMVYMPLLEETGHMPTEKYAHGPEILEHCQRIGKHFGLYDGALFHTEVTGLDWDEARARWVVRTDRGDEFTAQFLSMGTGPLHVPKLPGVPGIDEFEGHAFHTSRWDYSYTGGDPTGAPMTGLADKRVAVIGTGATAVQCVPRLAHHAGELFVFQRTPSSVDVRGNHPIDPEWFAGIATPGWQQRWLENFTMNQTGALVEEDLVMDGWTELARRILHRIASLEGPVDLPRIMEAVEDADFEKMEQIRARCDEVVEDPETAQKLKAWYRQLCKRPCFHDEYLQAYNNPNVHLVDTDGKGVERITPTGVVVSGVEHEVDCIIFASGFEVGTPFTERAGYDPVGRGGRRLSQYWADGMRTLHGMHVHGFPNLFITQLGHGANLISNVPHNFTETSRAVAAVVRHAVEGGHRVVEVTEDAEQAWMELISGGGTTAVGSALGSADCTPGYYNNEGQPGAGFAGEIAKGHPGGPMAFFEHLRGWTAGGFDGVEFR